MQLISTFNKGVIALLRVVDIYSKYVWVVLLKDKKGITITNAFQIILDESSHKPNKIWVDNGFYNRSMKSWLQGNGREMHSAHNEAKSVVAERFIRTLKKKFYKYMTLVSKNVHVDKLDDILNKYNNTYHRTMKMEPIDVKSSTYIDFGTENNDKYPKFKGGDHVGISKYQNIFSKGNGPNRREEVFVIKNVKNTVPWTYVVSDINSEKIVGMFYKKNCKRQIKQNLGQKK